MKDFAARRALREAAEQALLWRNHIVGAFQRELTGRIDRKVEEVLIGEHRGTGALEVRADELKLVDAAVIEDEVAVDRLAQTARAEIDEELRFGVESRLGKLMGRGRLQGSANPLSVETVFSALKSACAAPSGGAPLQAALSDALKPHLAHGLRDLYAELNTSLVEAGVLPDLRFEVRQTAAQRKKPQVGSGALGGIGKGTGGGAGAAGAGEGSKSTRGGSSGAPEFELAQSLAMANRMRSTHAANAGGNVRAWSGAVDGETVASVFEAAEAAAKNTKVDVAAVVTTVLSGPPEAIQYGARILADEQGALYKQAVAVPVAPSVVDSLTQAQHKVPPAESDRPQALPGVVLTAPLKSLPAGSTHAVDDLTSELVAVVFQHLFNDPQLPDYVKHELSRLQIVAFKAAVLDRSFFARKEHPLRRMLTGIGALVQDPSIDAAPGGAFAKALAETVQFLISRFVKDLLVFDTALERLQTIARADADRTERDISDIAMLLVAREREESARARALIDIEERVSSSTPPFIVRFLRDTWASIVADAEVRGLKDDQSREARLQVVDDLIWSVLPKGHLDVPKLVKMLPKLVPTLRGAARTAGVSFDDEQTFLDELMKIHTGLLQAARGAKPTTVVGQIGAAPAPLAPVAVTDISVRQALGMSATVIPFPKLARGQVVEFTDAGERVRRKLAWISPQRSLYIFCANDAGPLSMSAKELSEAIRRGRVKMVGEEETAIDRAIAHVTGEVREARAA